MRIIGYSPMFLPPLRIRLGHQRVPHREQASWARFDTPVLA